jgi:thioredoxin 1
MANLAASVSMENKELTFRPSTISIAAVYIFFRTGEMAEIIDIDDASFEREVLQAGGAVLVDFGAEWCHPCKQLDPIVDEIALELEDKLKVTKLDIDENVDSTMKWGVMGVPTLILFKDGEPVERLTGYVPKNRILDKLSPHLG